MERGLGSDLTLHVVPQLLLDGVHGDVGQVIRVAPAVEVVRVRPRRQVDIPDEDREDLLHKAVFVQFHR
jgi:hypothetical protein